MEKTFRLLCGFLLICCSSLLFIHCSNELSITSPSNNLSSIDTQTSLEIRRGPDTLIYLPISKMKIGVSKGLTPDNIAKLDIYYSTHKLSSNTPNKINPMLPLCGTHYEFVWIPMDIYRAVPNKILGLDFSSDVVSWKNAIQSYGFSKVFVTNSAYIDTAHKYGLSYDNIMFGLSDPTNAANEIADSHSGTRNVGSYFIDEPQENYWHYNHPYWSYQNVVDVNSLIIPTGKKLFLSSWISPPYHDYVLYLKLVIFILCATNTMVIPHSSLIALK
jgi:hypothetical protein